MGWCGNGLYDGDDTQTQHITFIEYAVPSLSKLSLDERDDWVDITLQRKKTKIPDNLRAQFIKGIPNILKKISKPRFWDENSAIEWQMLLSLCVDNNLIIPHKILVNGIIGSAYLLGEHCNDFDYPNRRRKVIQNFMKKVEDNFLTIKAQKEIMKMTGIKNYQDIYSHFTAVLE